MIYNLVEFLKNEIPTEVFYTNERRKLATQQGIPDRCVLIREGAAPETPWFKFVRKNVQVLVRDKSAPAARKLAWDIMELLTSRFGLIFPVVVVGGDNFPEIQIAQISAIQQPYDLGVDEEGRTEFVNNYQIIYRR